MSLTSLGPYASFIIGSYVLVALVVLVLIVWIAADQHHQQNALRELEARGVMRRSAAKAGDK
ncbi:MAG TPA: heme exporter protein CcmD [Afipia sp.]